MKRDENKNQQNMGLNDRLGLESFVKNSRRKRFLRRAIALMSAVVLLFTMNSMKFEATTLERIATCGYPDHEHGPECFDADGVLICEQHVHTDACYQESPDSNQKGESIFKYIDSDGSNDNDPGADEGNPGAVYQTYEYAFEMGTQSPVLLSYILEQTGLAVAMDEILAIGPVEDTEAQVGLIGVEPLEGDYNIYALKNFEIAELAIVTEADIPIITLLKAVLPEPDRKSVV